MRAGLAFIVTRCTDGFTPSEIGAATMTPASVSSVSSKTQDWFAT